MLAVAGGLDLETIAALDRVAPDIVAVRGAACFDGDRRAAIDPVRVAELARAVAAVTRPTAARGCLSSLDSSGAPRQTSTPWARGRSVP